MHYLELYEHPCATLSLYLSNTPLKITLDISVKEGKGLTYKQTALVSLNNKMLKLNQILSEF